MHLRGLVARYQVENQIGLTPDVNDLLAMACTRFKATMYLEVSTTYLVLPWRTPAKS